MSLVRILGPIAVFGIAFLYQLIGQPFPNDHFDHLSKARQVLHGEYPVRDFFDPGRPLTIGLSAAALHLSGDTLFGEAMLTMGAMALAIALVFVLTLRLTQSTWWACWAAGCTLLIDPRLYNYPKVLVCTVAFLLIARYLDAPSTARAVTLGAWGAVGFLFRHDLGLYLALTTAAALVVSRAREVRRAAFDACVAGAMAVVVAAPYVIYLLQAGTLAAVVTGGSGVLLQAADVTWRPFVGPGADGTTWLRLDAENWLYYLFLFTPPIAFLLRLGRRLAPSVANHVFVLAILCDALVVFLIRGNLDSRLPDVAAPSFVLVAWMLAALGTSSRPPSSGRRAIGRTALVVLATVTTLSVGQVTDWEPVRRAARTLPHLPQLLSERIAALRADPLETWEREGTTDVRGLARWMRQCTTPDDRVLVFGYHPEVFFYSRRRFAGGMPFLHAAYFSSPDEQRLTVARLTRQSVPFVIVETDTLPALDGTYAIVGEHVRRHYALAAETTFGGPRSFRIFRNEKASLRLSATGLPCVA